MNWYKVFYWISVADRATELFQAAAVIFTILIVMSLICYFISVYNVADYMAYSGEDSRDVKTWIVWRDAFKKVWRTLIFFLALSWIGYVLLPSKKDFLVIVAGGAVGNFITRDTSAKQIPSEVMTLLRDKIKSEINEVHLSDAKDTLVNKSKEELMEIIKNKKNGN